MSACFSCYKQLFAEGQEFTYDLKDLAGYYNNYVELMNHWNKVLPNQILSINYEDVVNNFEDSVKKFLIIVRYLLNNPVLNSINQNDQ